MLSVIWLNVAMLNVIMVNVMTLYTAITNLDKPLNYSISHVKLIHYFLHSICKETNFSVVNIRWGVQLNQTVKVYLNRSL